MISYPGYDSTSVNTLFEQVEDDIDSVFTYRNGEWKQYILDGTENNLKTLELGDGMWIKAKIETSWTFDGKQFIR